MKREATNFRKPLEVGLKLPMKKPKKSGSEFYNYKGLFSAVLLAFVVTDYRFLWVDVRSSSSSSDAQILNCSNLRKKIKNGTLGLPPPELMEEGESDLHYFLLSDDTFALVSWLVKPYSRIKLTREERIANYRISRTGG